MTALQSDIIALLERILDRLSRDGGHPIYPGSLAHREIETVVQKAREEERASETSEGTCQR